MLRTAGPAQAEVLHTWLLQRMTESMQRVHDQLQGATREQHSSLEQRHAEALKHSASLEQAKQQWQAEREELARRLEAAEESSRANHVRMEPSLCATPWRRTRALPPCLRDGTPPSSRSSLPLSGQPNSKDSTHAARSQSEVHATLDALTCVSDGLPRPKQRAKRAWGIEKDKVGDKAHEPVGTPTLDTSSPEVRTECSGGRCVVQ